MGAELTRDTRLCNIGSELAAVYMPYRLCGEVHFDKVEF